ncbi:HTH domain-containing protein [Klenkia soli]|uniref:HTH domain-containing protein n=1 Tax=Klenkia soli TaxID=1052260 RepID=A0A1H0F4Y4_9ACTN|nr:helix-turn-helix domain-containing protein [Klenkia soli]SDN89643.1 HTH domain-containing protein [Klenkia soli]
MTADPVQVEHPLLTAVAPLLARVGGELVDPGALAADDVPLVWEGQTVAGVRFGGAVETAAEPAGDLAGLLAALAAELGAPLADLPRPQKQRAVRLLEERGAFAYRRSAETVAEALGVSRFTVYNYLNRERS